VASAEHGILYAHASLLAVATFATWQGWVSCFAAAATALSTIGRIQNNETFFRVLMLATTPLWAVHDVMVGSLPGLAADILSMTTVRQCC
jgi:Bacterial inner membrane protein